MLAGPTFVANVEQVRRDPAVEALGARVADVAVQSRPDNHWLSGFTTRYTDSQQANALPVLVAREQQCRTSSP